ncbi:MAG: sugar transferase, partial [Candidatus Marinimicrobia bacterium]|nr:sugar transferase [Candidatus Neomarinimicrobiota bacterium]
MSWILVIFDAFAGYFVIDQLLNQFEISYPVIKIYLVLQITIGLLFWYVNLYKGDAQTSRFVETENLIKLTFFIMAAAVFLLGIDVDLGPIKSQFIIRYWILYSFLTTVIRWIVRSIQKLLLRKGVGQRNVIVIGTGDNSKFVTGKLIEHGQKLYKVLGSIRTSDEKNKNVSALNNYLGDETELKSIISKNPVSDIVIALDNMDHDHIMKLISIINGAPVSIKIVPDLYEVISGLARTEQISGLPLIEVNFQESQWSSSGMKRLFDFILSVFSLIMLFPLFTTLALIISFTSKGPIIYRQKRLGFKGKPYMIYKFRSMVID